MEFIFNSLQPGTNNDALLQYELQVLVRHLFVQNYLTVDRARPLSLSHGIHLHMIV